jgi:hypothetical protein
MDLTRYFQDRTTGQTLICDNIRVVRRFNGAEWLSVRTPDSQERRLRRRDELQEVNPQ